MVLHLSLSILLSIVGQAPPSVEPKYLIFDRGDAKLQEWVDKLPPETAESELVEQNFRRQDLPSGVLYLHHSADRLRSIKPTIELLTFLSTQLTDTSLVIDLSQLPAEKLREFAVGTMLGSGFRMVDGSGRMHAKVQIKSMSVVWVEKDGKLAPIQCFSMTEPKRDADRGPILEIPGLQQDRRSQQPPVGPRRWGIGVLGAFTRQPGQELKLGRLIAELGELTDIEIKRVAELQASLGKRVFEADPWTKGLRNVTEGQSWASLPEELKKQIRMTGTVHGMDDPTLNAFLDGAKLHRIVPSLGVSTKHEKGPDNSYGVYFNLWLPAW